METAKVMKTEAIKRMLLAMSPPHSQDLAALYNHDMEMQLTVAQDDGERIDKDYNGRKWHGYTNGTEIWKSIRVPYDANSEPHYEDGPLTFDITTHTDGIGLTGFDWKSKVSRWVGFDFDSITNHKGSGITDAEMEEVVRKASEIPWITIRKSTSGNGLHLYVFLNGVPCENHTQHAALARSILGKMSATVGYDFSANVDCLGHVLWIWHRKQRGTDGLSLVKQGVPLVDIPPNWKDHVDVVTNKRKKIKPSLIADSESKTGTKDPIDEFEELAGQHLQVPLDSQHKALMAWLENNMAVSWWDADHHMLVCHTSDLKKAHTELKLKGVFETNTSGSSEQNCFAFPKKHGQWTVRRFSPGVQEHESWYQDSSGWTTTHLNREPDLETVARTLKGTEEENGGFVFQNEGGKQVALAGGLLGFKITIPEFISRRQAKIKHHKDKGRVVVSIEHDKSDKPEDMPGWLPKKGNWVRVFNVTTAGSDAENEATYDDLLRHIVSIGGEDGGWLVTTEKGWVNEPLTHVKHVLESQNFNPNDIKTMLGTAITKCWAVVNKPFDVEYPGNREWNKDAAQLRFLPSQKDADKLHFPTWSMILNHLGQGLDEGIRASEWAKKAGMVSGADYLKVWISSMFKKPYDSLPYLFFYGPQNCGKSMFHESLELLMKGGACRADNALTNQAGFNYELANKVLCVIEEVNLQKAGTVAYNRIKDWCTSPMMPIHQKNGTPYTIRNTSKWVQTSNESSACPIFPGDTRITVVEVQPIAPGEYVSRKEFVRRLEEEAPDFLASIMNLELPEVNDRLNLPVINTEQKLDIVENNRTQTELFFKEKLHYFPGESIEMKEVYDMFYNWLDPERRLSYSKVRFGREKPMPFLKGTHPGTNQVLIGNCSYTKPTESQLKNLCLVLVNGKLVKSNANRPTETGVGSEQGAGS